MLIHSNKEVDYFNRLMLMGKKRFITGDRPTGPLHLGHLVGSLNLRVELQESGEYDPMVFIADRQALTDHAKEPELIRKHVLEVAYDYLSVGIDPTKTNIFIQSQIPQLTELTSYFLNLVTLARLERNPTVKSEMKQKHFGRNVPVGFLVYPVDQTSDIVAFKAEVVPAGEDQLAIVEQGRELVRTFNKYYGETLIEPKVLLPKNEAALRLPGIDGQKKMVKSLGNAIYLKDSREIVKEKVMRMFTDPGHLKVSDPGKVEGNPVFQYLRAFSTSKAELEQLAEFEENYKKGGLGDVVIKRYLADMLNYKLDPIREKRSEFENNPREVLEVLMEGSKVARNIAAETLSEVRDAIGIEYFKEYDMETKREFKGDFSSETSGEFQEGITYETKKNC